MITTTINKRGVVMTVNVRNANMSRNKEAIKKVIGQTVYSLIAGCV